uniref:proteasome activator complex subunit 3-like isoform X2 n=1 Tax=Gasterosteus aculeatus aculeatus TaxID=481459 RepID=UPI001A985082|nr:proteasome activator complex subunit 3-like isoform X2 [Gasterosteus aculeatus aculeatus]
MIASLACGNGASAVPCMLAVTTVKGFCFAGYQSGFKRLFIAMSSLLKVDRDLKNRVETFREQISSEAEHLVASFFPKKLLELDQFLKNTKKRKLEDGVADESWQGGTKTLTVPEGMLKCNTKLVDLIERVKPEIRTLIEKCNTVKMWVQLLIPRIEDGNNFGVSIQEETVAELRTVESEAASYLDQISRYYITRAKLVSKIVKYPHVEDYRRTITEIDEKEYISLKIIVSELRNQYVILHDMILKNIEKIKKPRNSNAEALY